MTAPVELGTDRDKLCAELFDPSCPGIAEPEQDGEHRYYTCSECGNDFGWHLAAAPTMTDKDSCQLGVPVSVRQAASAPMEGALRKQAKAEPVPLTLTFRRSS